MYYQFFSVILTLKIDCSQRLNNLEFCIKYWKLLGFSNIYVIEQDVVSRLTESFKLQHKDVVFRFYATSHFDAFHKTFLNNKALTEVKTPYAILGDVDFIIPEKQISESCEQISNNEAQFITPFSTCVYEVDISQIESQVGILEKIDTAGFIRWPTYSLKTMNQWMPFFDELPILKDEFFECSMGGVFMLSCEAYLQAGYDNEAIIGWAFDDHERIERVKKLGFTYKPTFLI